MIQLEISDFKIIDEDLKIDGILFLGHRHILFFEDYVQTPLTSHCQARAALKLQLWEVGTVGRGKGRA